MDIVGKAIDLEIATRDYYDELCGKSVADYAGPALRQLAMEEQKHADLLRQYRSTGHAAGSGRLPNGSEYDDVWQGFMDAVENVRMKVQPHTDEITVLQRAISLEEEGLTLYRYAARCTGAAVGKRLFTFLAAQEERHRVYLEKLLKRILPFYEEPAETRPQL